VAKVPDGLFKDPWLLLQVIGFQFLIFVLDAATLTTLVRSLGRSIDAIPSFVSFMLASMAGTVSPIPGGLGTFEAGLVGALRLYHVSVKAGLAATLLLRGFTLWLPLLPGLLLSRKELFRTRRRTPH